MLKPPPSLILNALLDIYGLFVKSLMPTLFSAFVGPSGLAISGLIGLGLRVLGLGFVCFRAQGYQNPSIREGACAVHWTGSSLGTVTIP